MSSKNIDLSRSYAHFCKKYIRMQENCIKGDLASCNTVHAHIRREPNIKTSLYNSDENSTVGVIFLIIPKQ